MITTVPQSIIWAHYGTPQQVVEKLIGEIRHSVGAGDQPVASQTIVAASFLPGGGAAPDEEIIDTVTYLAGKLLPEGIRVAVSIIHHKQPERVRFTHKRRRLRTVIVLSTLVISLRAL